jgi:hypothetical protein
MFEEWVRGYATKVKESPSTKIEIVLPTHPGATDEIEDVVVIENNAVVMFSVKGRMVREDIARYSLSRRQLLDWYEKYFFENKNDAFRGGALRQISARIDMLRRGEFEDRGITKNVRVHPVIVTYDSLCENQLLYSWLNEKCKEHRVLQQSNVGKPVLAEVQEFERLIGVAADGGSIVKLLEKRHTQHWADERLEVILSEFDAPLRLPGYDVEYTALMRRMGARIGIPPERIADAASRAGVGRRP